MNHPKCIQPSKRNKTHLLYRPITNQWCWGFKKWKLKTKKRRSDTHVQDLRLIGIKWTMPFQTFITNWAKGLNWNTCILGSGFPYETHILGVTNRWGRPRWRSTFAPSQETSVQPWRNTSTISGCFFLCINHLLVVEPPHLKNMLVKLELFPNFRGEHRKYLKPPPSKDDVLITNIMIYDFLFGNVQL